MDVAGTRGFAEDASYYGSNGVIVRYTQTTDAGDFTDTRYSGGKRISVDITDGGANDAWTTKHNDYAADGVTVTASIVTYDNGDRDERFYDSGALTRRHFVDGSNTRSYSEYTNYYTGGVLARSVSTIADLAATYPKRSIVAACAYRLN